MKNAFMKKVAVLSAGAVALSSLSFFGVHADPVVQETLLSGSCTGELTITAAHGYDFGNFNVADVSTGSFFQTQGIYLDDGAGKEHSTFGDVKEAVWVMPGNEASTTTGRMFAVADPCPEEHIGWELQIQAENMVHNTNAAIELNADAIKVEHNGDIFLVGSSSPVNNSEVTNDGAFDLGGLNLTYGVDTTNTVFGTAGHGVILERSTSTNLLPGEFGVILDLSINVPRNQPAGTYTGDVILTLVELD